MDYQKIIILLDNTDNQPSKFRTRNWDEIKDESRAAYNNNENTNIKFETSMIRTTLCDYSDAYILVKGTISIPNMVAQGAAINNTNKEKTCKNCAPFTNCLTEIKKTQVENTEYIVMVMSMYNLMEYGDVYLKISGSLWQYYRGYQL